MRPGANCIPVDGDRAVRPRSFSAYNGRNCLLWRRRVPVAMVRAGVGRTPGGDRRVVQAGDPGHLARHAGGLVPIILVTMYPGLLLFRNVLTAELLFAVLLNLALAGLLVATCVGKTARCCAVAASILCAALAACFRSQGILVPIAAVVMGAR